jgi:hypothetical protein
MIGILVLTGCGPTQGFGQLLLAPTGFVASTIALCAVQRERNMHSILNLRDVAEQRKVKVTPFPLRKRYTIKMCGDM